MKALITGGEGFIGSHLVEFLLGKGLKVYATVYSKDLKNLEHVKSKINIIRMDISDRRSVSSVINKIKPNYIFHLAAQAYVMPSWKDIEKTFKSNIFGTLYLLEATRKTGINPIIVAACSSAEYGFTYDDEIPIKEAKEFRPSSPYAISKIGTDMLCYLYSRTYNMKIIRARLFNTAGPRKIGNAVADFAEMIAEAEKGKLEVIRVGNLEGVVDITDGRDTVRALWTLAQKGEPGEAYNVCSGRGYKMEEILSMLIALSGKKIALKTDKKKLRPLEDPIFIGNNSKLTKLGWKPGIQIEKTLKDTLNYWRTAR